MADEVKLGPAELVRERERVARNRSDRIVAVDVPRIAIAANIREGICERRSVKMVEHGFIRTMVAEPTVQNDDLFWSAADGFVPHRLFSLAYLIVPSGA